MTATTETPTQTGYTNGQANYPSDKLINWNQYAEKIKADNTLTELRRGWCLKYIPGVRKALSNEFRTYDELYAAMGGTGKHPYLDFFMDKLSRDTHMIIGRYRPGKAYMIEYRLKGPNEIWAMRERRHKVFAKSKKHCADITTVGVSPTFGIPYSELEAILAQHRDEVESWIVPQGVREMIANGIPKDKAYEIYNAIKRE